MDNNLIALACLHSVWFTQKDLKMLFSASENYQEVYDTILAKKGIETPWIPSERKAKIISKLGNIQPSQIESTLARKSIKIITLHKEEYPEKLKTIHQAPFLFYVRWDFHETDIMLSVVGSRKSTIYGKRILENILPGVIAKGIWIVSWWAFGIDAISHEIAIKNGWYTLSVFGCGVDIYYPSENTELFENIIKTGWALLSIFPLSTKPEPYNFPIRNEIVAALSDGVIIPEAGEKSGTIITAWLALEHGRDVFAAPWDIFKETSQWTNKLIATGQAKCILSAEDVLEEYFWNNMTPIIKEKQEKEFGSEIQSAIYSLIQEGYTTPDSLITKTQYWMGEIITNLALLEMDWHILLGPWGKYEPI